MRHFARHLFSVSVLLPATWFASGMGLIGAARLPAAEPAANASAHPRCALVADGSPLGALVETRLLEDRSVEWLERNEVDKVLAEQQLQAAMAADAPQSRAELGRLLKADVLALLRTGEKKVGDKPQNFAELAVAETASGLRLVARTLPLSENAEADAEVLTRLVREALARWADKVDEVYAVPPFVSQDLTYEHDHLKTAYARLVEQSILQRPGTLVVELSEAEALAREHELAPAGGAIQRRLPLYILGEYRHDGRESELRVRISLKLMRGQEQVDQLEEVHSPDDALAMLRRAADRFVGANRPDATGADSTAEALQLFTRADELLRLAGYAEALPLLEAGLLLKPDDVAWRLKAYEAAMRLADELDAYRTRPTLESVKFVSRASDHLAEIVRRDRMLEHLRPVAYDVHHGTLKPMFPDELGEDVRQPYQAQRERRLAILREMAHRAAEAGQWDLSALWLNGALEPLEPTARYAERAKFILQYQDGSGAAERVRQYAHFGYTIGALDSLEGRRFLRDLAASAEASAEVKSTAEQMLAEVEADAQARAAKRKAEQEADRQQREKSSRLSFQPVELVYTNSKGHPDTLKYLTGCLPVDGDTDLLWIERYGVFVSKDKGRAKLLWTHTHMNAWIRLVSYDGRYAWVSVHVHGQAPEVWVLDPREEKSWQITAEHGLPLASPDATKGTVMTPSVFATAVAPGRAIVVGWIGRAWAADVRFDPHGKHQVRVFHEAKETPQEQSPWENTQLVYRPDMTLLLSAPSDLQADQRLIIRRNGAAGLFGHPLIVDPADLSVAAYPEQWYGPNELNECGFHNGAVYFTGARPPAFDRIALLRRAAPDLELTVVRENVAEGNVLFDGDIVNVVGKQWQRGKLGEGEWASFGDVPWHYDNHWAASPQDPPRSMQRGDLDLEFLAPSRHYGCLVCCRVEGGDPILAQVLFDGSGQPLQPQPATPPAAPIAGLPEPRVPGPGRQESLWGESRRPYVALARSPDGTLFATASEEPAAAVQLWAADGQLIASLLDHPGGACEIAFSPSGRRLAAGTNDGQVVVWSVADRQPLKRLVGHEEPIESLAFSWDDALLASACRRRIGRLWELASGREVMSFERRSQGIHSMAFAPDGKRLLASSVMLDLETGRETRIETIASIIGFLPDRSLLATTNSQPSRLVAWDWNTGTYRVLHEDLPGGVVAVSPDLERVGVYTHSGLRDGRRTDIFRFRVVNTRRDELLRLDLHGGLRSATFFTDGSAIVVASWDNTVRRWELDAPAKAAKALRTWTDRSGQFRIEAELVEVGDGLVKLLAADGTPRSVPIARLSEADRRYVAQQAAANVQSAPPETPPAAAPRRVTVEDLQFPVEITPERREWAEALAAFHSEEPADETFATLEKWLDRCRRDLKPTAEGVLLLELTYEALSRPTPATLDEDRWKAHFAKLERWRKLHSRSGSVDAALGHSYFMRGILARGPGLASTVTEEGWKQLAEDIPRARASLERAAKLLKNDPQVYAELIAVAKLDGGARDQAEGYLRRAKAIAPAYFPAYQQMMDYLLPRWHGETGDPERFTIASADELGGDQGLELLGRLVFRMYGYERDAAEQFPLDRVWKAARLMHERYPASEPHHQFAAKAACMADEREAAEQLFRGIHQPPNPLIWSRPKVFDAYRRWARPEWPRGLERRLLWHSRDGFANGLALSPDGKLLVSTGWSGSRCVKFWDAASGALLDALPSLATAISAAAFSPDGKRLAIGTVQGPIYLLDSQTREPVAMLASHNQMLDGLAFSPDSRLLASSGQDDVVRIWDVAAETERFAFRDPAITNAAKLDFSPDGKLLAALGGGLRAWNTATGEPAELPAGIAQIAGFHPDGTVVALAANGRTVVECELGSGKTRELFDLPSGDHTVYLSPDGRTLAVNEQNRAVGAGRTVSFRLLVWDIASARQTAACAGHTCDINRVVFSHDSRTVITASDDGTVRLWDVPPPAAAAPAPSP